MDNRFNVKDIVLMLLVVLVGGVVLLSMMQNQRHWKVLEQTNAELKQQRDSVDQYEGQLDTYQREQQALRDGIQALITQLKASAGGEGGPRLTGDVEINLDADKFKDDQTFSRVAGLKTRDDFAEGDYFIDVFGTTVKNLTPYVAGDIYASRISEYVLESLLTIDPETLEHRPWVAKSWEVSEDGLVFTFHMRDDVVFSDGHAMDANDVVFTYEWVMNPRVAAPRMRSQLEKVESVVALDDHTVQFTFREPYFMSLTVCGLYLWILPEHWVSQFTEDRYNEMPGLLFGSGPYKMSTKPEDWESGSQAIELVRNENYWGPRPPMDKIIWREILEPTAQITSFRNRDVDRLSVRASMYRNLSTDQQLRDQADLLEYDYVSSGYLYIGWNQKRNGQPTAFADKRVRQAMTLLIDRNAICGQVYENLARPATGPFHPLGWQADPNLDAWPYDPERAKALLNAAGYIDRDGNGVRESPDGEPLSFEFIHSANSSESTQLAQMIKNSMAQAGVDFNPEPMDWPVMQQKLDDRNFDSIMLGWGGAVESDLYQMFHSEQTEDGGDNYVHYTNPALDELIDQARTAVDREACQKLWWKVHGVLHEDQPYTFMMNRKSVVFVDRRLQNVEITKRGLNNAWEYYVPRPMQQHSAP